MPGGDRTGPSGQGPMTGRAAGYCTGSSAPGFANHGGGFFRAGRGAFGARGRGRGYRNWFNATGQPGWSRYNMGLPAWGGAAGVPYPGDSYYPQYVEPGEETKMLKDEADFLKQQLDDIKKRMTELEKEKKSK